MKASCDVANAERGWKCHSEASASLEHNLQAIPVLFVDLEFLSRFSANLKMPQLLVRRYTEDLWKYLGTY